MDANQDRREFKFMLPYEQGEKFRAFISDIMPVDRGAENGYPVLSEYYDSYDRHSYWQKKWGVGNRRRVRARVYGRNDGTIPPAGFIEIKHKLDGDGVKRRVQCPIQELPLLAQGVIPPSLLQQKSTAANRLLTELEDLLIKGNAKPVVQLRYDRMAYDSGPEGTIRVTIDHNLRCRFGIKPLIADDQDFPHRVIEDEVTLIEIKTIGNVPTWLRNATGKFNLLAQSISKYSLALERYDAKISPHFPKHLNTIP